MRKNQKRHGNRFIYFIGPVDRDVGYVKIGITGKPVEKRLPMIQTGNPHKLEIYGFIEMDLIYEAMLHSVFQPMRMSGEWFRYESILRILIEDVEASFGTGCLWDSQAFWTAFLRVFRSNDYIGKARPQAMASIDSRILAIFPESDGCGGGK